MRLEIEACVANPNASTGSASEAGDGFYVGNMKGVGRIYQQTFIDTYAKVAFAKLYDRKTPITAADDAIELRPFATFRNPQHLSHSDARRTAVAIQLLFRLTPPLADRADGDSSDDDEARRQILEERIDVENVKGVADQ
jgi:hypothetical protein